LKNKGFTLVEVLAVLVIIGVIALIVVPKVSDIISSAKKQAGMESALSYVRAVDQYVIEANDDDSKDAHISNGDNLFSYITISGTKASEGKIYVDEDKNVSIALQIGAYCYKKEAVDKNADITVTKTDTCTVEPNTPTSCFTYHKLTSEDVSTYNNLLSVGDIGITGYSCGDTLKTAYNMDSPLNVTHSVFNNDGTYTDIEIPSTIDGSPVTGIANGAFECSEVAQKSNKKNYNIKPSHLGTEQNDIEPSLLDAFKDSYDVNKTNGSGIHTLVLPSSMKYIGDVSFEANEVEKLTFSSNKIYIGFGAFMLNSLTSLDLPNDSTLGLEPFAFNNITSFTLKKSYTRTDDSLGLFMGNKISSLTIEDGVTAIGVGDFAFNNIKSVTIPSSVTSIGMAAFEMNNITNVTIPSSVTTIGDGAFGYNKLTDITIPSSVTSIGGAAFNCNDVPVDKAIIYARNTDGTENKTTIVSYAHTGGTVTVPTTVTTLSAQSFSAVGLTSITIPSSVTSIGAGALANNSLTSVTIPNSVTSIGEDAFEENQLTNVTIPSSVTSIGDYAFEDNHLTSVTIPSSVTNIGAAAFNINDFPLDKAIIYARNSDGTENKTIIVSYAHTGDSVTIPDGVTTIGNCAFGYSYLTSVTIPNSVTSIEYDSFENNSSLTAITVDNMPNKIANSPWGATNATITYLRGVHINIDSSITDLNVSPSLVVEENSTITFTSSTLGKKLTSVTIDGVVNSGNTFTVGTADISVTAYTYDTVPYYTFESAHNYANNLDGSVSGT